MYKAPSRFRLRGHCLRQVHTAKLRFFHTQAPDQKRSSESNHNPEHKRESLHVGLLNRDSDLLWQSPDQGGLVDKGVDRRSRWEQSNQLRGKLVGVLRMMKTILSANVAQFSKTKNLNNHHDTENSNSNDSSKNLPETGVGSDCRNFLLGSRTLGHEENYEGRKRRKTNQYSRPVPHVPNSPQYSLICTMKPQPNPAKAR